MAKPTADEFISALRRLEEGGDVQPLLELHADDSRISNPTDNAPHEGMDGARRFWEAYRAAFHTIHSRFHTILESDGRAMLEWTSDCETAAGVRTSYDGVSVFETRAGRISRFTAYFDPADLTASHSAATDGEARGDADAGAYGATHGGVERGTSPAIAEA